MTAVISGQCLCGAVTVTVRDLSDAMWACHCEMCRRWSGGLLFGIEAPAGSVSARGPIKSHRSSSFTERAWCDTCGSALWLRTLMGNEAGDYDLASGLFENAGGARLHHESYSDCCPDGYALAGDHQRITRAQYERDNPRVLETHTEEAAK
jgi:hypothetical protein